MPKSMIYEKLNCIFKIAVLYKCTNILDVKCMRHYCFWHPIKEVYYLDLAFDATNCSDLSDVIMFYCYLCVYLEVTGKKYE